MPITPEEKKMLRDTARELRLTMIDIMAWSGGAHIGGSLSIADILTILYFKYLNVNPGNPQWEDRDRFILSKGHSAAGFIPTLAKKGYFPEEELKSFNHFGSPFAMHPDGSKVVGCDASAGSLGHGLSMAVGLGLGARYLGKTYKTVCLMGDGECCEGSVWEAAMSLAHFGLRNVIPVVDRNRLMIDGFTEDIMALEPFADKWRAFGFEVLEVNGHDFDELAAAFDKAWAAGENTGEPDKAGEPGNAGGKLGNAGGAGTAGVPGNSGGKPGEAGEGGKSGGKPVMILANTVKGKGVDFMENNVVYHYASGDSAVCERAKASIMKG